MVTLLKNKIVEIAIDGTPPLLPPLVIARDDLTNQRAWDKLEKTHDPYLEVDDFIDVELYEKYWLASLGILEYPYMFLAGDVGTGKSLFLNWMLHKITKHYGKKAVINWVAENPVLISPFNKWEEGSKEVPYHTMTEKDYVDRIQDEINELNHCLIAGKRKPSRAELEKLVLFNSHFAIDEGSGVAGIGLGTNLIKLLGMLSDRRRHLFLGMMISFVRPQDATGRLGQHNATHLVSCSKDVYYVGACSYRIYHIRNGITKMLHLKPEEWTHLWDTHNLVAINAAANVQFGNKKAKENEKKRQIMQEAS